MKNNNSIRKLKLTPNSFKFHSYKSPTSEHVTVCTVSFNVHGDSRIVDDLIEFSKYSGEHLSTYVSVSTKLRDGDVYDEEKGRKIAIAKAEKIMYRRIYKFLRKYMIYQTENISEICRFAKLSRETADHNEQYIKNS